MNVKMINKSYKNKAWYNHTMFIYLKNDKNETITHTHINSYEKLDKNIVKMFIENNFSEYGLHVLDYLYAKINDYFDIESGNHYLSVSDNNELRTILS